MYNSLSLIGYNSELLIKQSQLSTLTSFIVPLLTFFRGLLGVLTHITSKN